MEVKQTIIAMNYAKLRLRGVQSLPMLNTFHSFFTHIVSLSGTDLAGQRRKLSCLQLSDLFYKG